MGVIHKECGRLEEAVAAYERALQVGAVSQRGQCAQPLLGRLPLCVCV